MTKRFHIVIAPERDGEGLWPMRAPVRALVELTQDRTALAFSYPLAPLEDTRSVAIEGGALEIGARSARLMRASVKIAVKRPLEIERVLLRLARSLDQIDAARDPMVAAHYRHIVDVVFAAIEKTVEDALSQETEWRDTSSVARLPSRPTTRS